MDIVAVDANSISFTICTTDSITKIYKAPSLLTEVGKRLFFKKIFLITTKKNPERQKNATSKGARVGEASSDCCCEGVGIHAPVCGSERAKKIICN